MKRLINSPESCVSDAIKGVLLSDSRVLQLEGLAVLVREDIDQIKQRCVTIVSGGGSGHEPAHAGFIGSGMLSCAVLGNVFASPPVTSILAAIRAVAGPMGVLLIVKNYTGDRLNFGLAAEMAKQEGIEVQLCIVRDDCALPVHKGITGGRGIAGTVFVHKIAGAAAALGMCLQDVCRVAEAAATNIYSLGLALSTCTVPGTPSSTRLSSPGLIELGMGIHGEPGREQLSLPSDGAASFAASLLVESLLGPVAVDGASAGPETTPRLQCSPGQRVAVLLNNLGSLPVIELQIVSGCILALLHERGLVPVRVYAGPYVTSLEMCGVSLSLFAVSDDDTLSLLDAPTTAPAWVPSARLEAIRSIDSRTMRCAVPSTTASSVPQLHGLTAPSSSVLDVAKSVCEGIVAVEPLLTQYDAICGDGDCGVVMKAGALRVLVDVIERGIDGHPGGDAEHLLDLSTFFTALAMAISASMGGTSGALLELCFRAMASSFSLLRVSRPVGDAAAGPGDWTEALSAGVKAIQFYGGAAIGMRTMLDALLPAVEALRRDPGDAQSAARAAAAGAEATSTMDSLAGRANYVSASILNGTPDPGAVAVATVFSCIAKHS